MHASIATRQQLRPVIGGILDWERELLYQGADVTSDPGLDWSGDNS
jgi:hypothetical protein